MPQRPYKLSDHAAQAPLTLAPARLAEHLRHLEEIPLELRRMRAATSAAELFAAAAGRAREVFGFDRALVLPLGDAVLSATGTLPLADPASDELRRRVLADPVPVRPGTLEHHLMRATTPRRGEVPTSHLAAVLVLEDPVLAAITAEDQPLALLVVDRPRRPVDVLDRADVMALGAAIGVALGHVVLRARIEEAFSTFRYLASSTQAVMGEVLHAPVAVPSLGTGGWLTVPMTPPETGADAGLTEREEQVAMLLVKGHSNREIAERLVISSETVKDCVVRVRRKLGAANRVDAAAKYLRLERQRH
ncbi:MAG: hypothetical protein JWO90_1607 [Solirubrobacterales bacterium]|nr:hypothetical protein [Solirubrobacterales bacterium]